MSVEVKRRREAASFLATFTGAPAELLVDTTNNRVQVHDGATPGGWAAAKLAEVVTNTRAAVADANYTALASDRTIAFTALTAARTVTLPAASSYPTGTTLTIFDESGSCSSTDPISVARAGSDTIDGATSVMLSSAYGYLALQSNGASKWTLVDQAASNLAAVGIGTAADPSNPLSVYGTSALFNSGADVRVKLNKASSSNTASFLFQDGFSGRAEIGLTGDDNFHFKVSSNGSAFNTGILIDAATGAVTLGNARTAVSDANYTALATDREIAYTALTAARTVTLPAASAYPAGTDLLLVDESGACSATNTITISRAGSDTIDGRTGTTLATAYGYLRLRCDGASKWKTAGRSPNIATFSSSGTYTPTPSMTLCDVYMVAGGGAGGTGCLQAASTACSGGGGGGAAGAKVGRFTAAQIGTSQSVTIGAGGTPGTPPTSNNTAGANGGNGGNTSFGSLLTAYGGGGGAGGQLATTSGGGGSGAFSVGGAATGASGGAAGVGGLAGGTGVAGSFGSAPWTGGSGQGCSATGAVSGSGGSSVFGGGGGGAGGGITSSNVTNPGGVGGGIYAQLNNGTPGGTAGGGGVAGGAGSNATGFGAWGSGGGGGGSSLAGTAGNGGAGGLGAGGGGGASAQNGGSAGAGGAGGGGYCLVIEFF